MNLSVQRSDCRGRQERDPQRSFECPAYGGLNEDLI